MARRRVNFTIDSHIDIRLNELALSEQVSRSEVVNRAIDRYDSRLRDEASYLLDAQSDWFFEMDADLRYTYFSENYNDTIARWSGISSKDLLGKTRSELYELYLGKGITTNAHDLRQSKFVYNARRPFRNMEMTHTRDGETRYLSVTAAPVFSETGAFLGYRGTGSDVTHIHTDLQIAQTIHSLRDEAGWEWETDANGRFTHVSESFEVVAQMPRSELLNRTRRECAEDWNNFFTHVDLVDEAVAAQKSFHDIQYPWLVADGVIRQFSISGTPKFDDSGSFIGYTGIGRDVTNWPKVLGDYAGTQDLAWCWITDKLHRYTWISDGYEDITGHAPTEIGFTRLEIAERYRNEFEKECYENLLAHTNDLLAQKAFTGLRMWFWPDSEGNDRLYEISGTPLPDQHGNFAGYYGTTRRIK